MRRTVAALAVVAAALAGAGCTKDSSAADGTGVGIVAEPGATLPGGDATVPSGLDPTPTEPPDAVTIPGLDPCLLTSAEVTSIVGQLAGTPRRGGPLCTYLLVDGTFLTLSVDPAVPFRLASRLPGATATTIGGRDAVQFARVSDGAATVVVALNGDDAPTLSAVASMAGKAGRAAAARAAEAAASVAAEQIG